MSDKPNWIAIEPSTLSPATQKAYGQYKSAYAAMKAARDAFEAAARSEANLPRGLRLAIGYNFGKLSFAAVPDDGKTAAPAKPAMSLAEYLTIQAAAGRRF